MARLDQLIDALVKHSAESLVLSEDTKPALIIGGTARPIVKTPLGISQVRQLAAEVTPSHQRELVLAGEEASFVYSGASSLVHVEITTSEVVIRPFEATAQEQAPVVEPTLPPSATGSDAQAEPSGSDSRCATGAPPQGVPRPVQVDRPPTDEPNSPGAAASATTDPNQAMQPTAVTPVATASSAEQAPLVHPVVESGTESPVISTVEEPAASQAEGPAVSNVKGPAVSHVEGPALSEVEGLNMDRMFHLMVEQGGCDLHMSAECRPMLRVDGSLAEMQGVPVLDATSIERILLEIAPQSKRDEFAENADTDFGYSIDGLARFRCNLFRDRKGVGGVFRIIPTEILSAEKMGLSKAIQDFTTLTKGLVLVTGPTGSGKSTTQAAMLDLINRDRADHVITIEDPIEFVHENKKCLINQREVHFHTKSFKSALRAALREDPDVVLVGELRDLETVAIAMETAETGHLVFGTLHTNSAVSTVDRVIDQFPADEQSRIRIMLSESLKGIVAQVLCKKIGGGRVAAHEVLVVNAAVSNLIREGKTFQIPSIMQTGRGLGMVTMSDALLNLVTKKLIEPKEAYLKAVDKVSLLGAFRSKKIPIDFLQEEKAVE